MIEKVLQKIKDQPITISQWVFGFIGIFFTRFFFEALSSPTTSGIIPSNAETLIHYGLFWIALTLGLILIVGSLIKDYMFASKLALFGLPVIWLAPVFDIVISHGNGFVQSYIFDSGHKLIFDLFTFFGPNLTAGATYGIRLEMIIVLITLAWFLWKVCKNVSSVVLGIISVYVLGFIIGSWPGIIYTLSHITSLAGTRSDIINFFARTMFQSTIAHNTLHEGISFVSVSRLFELCFDKLASQVLFLISCVFGGLLFWKINTEKFLAIIRNARPERIASYLALLFSGMGFAYINGLGNPFTWADLLGMFCLGISWISLWMYAVHSNDIADVEIDTISNTERPLVKKDLDEKSMRETGYVWLAMALLGSWCAGFYPFFMSLAYVFASHIYSSPPLRLRQFPIISSFLIGVASLATILSGFFFISVNKQIQTFPSLLGLGIVLMVTLAINVKDMKDIEGDKANGILTLPILFGKNGPKAVGVCFALSFLLVPLFLSFYSLYIIAIPCAYIGYRLVVKKPYRERPTIILRFMFLALVALLYLGTLWLGYAYHLI